MPRLSEQYPLAGESVINFGLPPMSGQLASRIDIPLLERTIKQAILRFEPRVMEDSLEVKAIEPSSVLDTHNVIEFEIRGFMWAQPVPLELLLRTQVDLEAGQIEVRDAASGSLKRKT
jgi:type VI secretion system protein ImpF